MLNRKVEKIDEMFEYSWEVLIDMMRARQRELKRCFLKLQPQ